jgi:hypothetical protein
VHGVRACQWCARALFLLRCYRTEWWPLFQGETGHNRYNRFARLGVVVPHDRYAARGSPWTPPRAAWLVATIHCSSVLLAASSYRRHIQCNMNMVNFGYTVRLRDTLHKFILLSSSAGSTPHRLVGLVWASTLSVALSQFHTDGFVRARWPSCRNQLPYPKHEFRLYQPANWH